MASAKVPPATVARVVERARPHLNRLHHPGSEVPKPGGRDDPTSSNRSRNGSRRVPEEIDEESVDEPTVEPAHSDCAAMYESDAELTARFEREAIPLLDRLYGGARRMTRRSADAEDLVQDTMLKAYTGFRSFQQGTHLQAWLFRIMHNTWISDYHKSRRRPTEHFGGAITDRQRFLICRSAEAEALEALPDSEIVEALHALPPNLRMTVYYADVCGHPYKEIAQIMGIPAGTVMSRLHRARRRLRMLPGDRAREHGLLSSRVDNVSCITHPAAGLSTRQIGAVRE